ncbi:family 43 glycosylhydrolase [Niabella beijingensis]|uniref:family 43 glycosylhydrolase n=1 Tax=Niabella beijingensis TaxID=2872700 RepID=UPI001CBADC04|nr:family 43 glycosylhydrolase [Niabella beijingensis]MBZ4190417.1 family 43 glycosylhydrolase [Niabella beijingensis]
MRFSLILLLFVFVVKSHGQQLVLPGDNPDPSVVKIGNEYWAAGTTSDWFPAFRLYRSADLVNWKSAGHVFTEMPAWADHYMWAPEITYDNGKVYLYYTAHKKGGSLCIAAAVADKPEGPYRDLGPLICQEDGSIDAFPVRDENGKLYMIWKEDGNSAGKPTPIWAAEMKEDRTGLVGEKTELFRGEAPWEQGLVEGVSVMKHNDYFYAFYAGAKCCGKACNYGTGIARSKNLLGPWEKYLGNPVLINDQEWKCPGHGTPVEEKGRFYFLYHGYSTNSGAYAGRQGLLNEFEFTADGWIRFLNGNTQTRLPDAKTFADDFTGDRLADQWHWSIFQDVHYTVSGNTLKLDALPSVCGAYIGQPVLASDYTAAVAVQKSTTAQAGLALIGDDRNLLYTGVQHNEIYLIQVKGGKETLIAREKIRKSPSAITIKATVTNNTAVRFAYSGDGKKFRALGDTSADISQLPPWDRAVRVGLISKGASGQTAFFKSFILKNQ